MGFADIIPGVSGGTIAFITGIYTRLVESISYIASLFNPDSFDDFFSIEKFKKIDWRLFIPLITGIVIAFLILSRVIGSLIENYRLNTYSFFLGLILASAIFLYKDLNEVNINTFFFSSLGLIIGFLIVGIEAFGASHSLIVLFFSGALAITAMILPGISGSFILLILGQYEYVLDAVNNLRFVEIIVVGMGAIIGLLSFSKLLSYLIHEYRGKTMSFLTGLMIGSLRLPFEVIIESNWSMNLSSVLVFVLVGFVTVFIVERLGQ